MKKLFVFAAFIFCAVLCAETQKATVTATVLNVRVKPSSKSDTLLQLKKGDEVIVLEKGDQWTAIRPPASSSLYVSSPLIENGKLKSAANLRAGSGVNFQSLGVLPGGTPVKVIEDKNSWSRIEVPELDIRCFVATEYLQFAENSSPAASNVENQNVNSKKDIISFSNDMQTRIKQYIVAGTEKKITVKGTLKTTTSEKYGTTYYIECADMVYHVAGVIRSSVDLDKPVVISGISYAVRSWKNPYLVILNCSNNR